MGSSTPPCVIPPHSRLGSDAGLSLVSPRAVLMLILTGPRRICPGRYFAQAGLFITVASVLHVFDITSPVDDRGSPVQVTHGMEDGLSSCVGFYRSRVLVVVLNSLHTQTPIGLSVHDHTALGEGRGPHRCSCTSSMRALILERCQWRVEALYDVKMRFAVLPLRHACQAPPTYALLPSA